MGVRGASSWAQLLCKQFMAEKTTVLEVPALHAEYCQTCSEITSEGAVNVIDTDNATTSYGTWWVFCHVLLHTASIHARRSIFTYHPAFKYLTPLVLVIGQRHVPSCSFIFPPFRASAAQATLFWLVSLTDCPSNSFIVIIRGRGVSISYLNRCTAFGSLPNCGTVAASILSFGLTVIVHQMLAIIATWGNEVPFSRSTHICQCATEHVLPIIRG
ncbi:hypothetical protein EDB84DRAFT_586820 [Lactarius hengduanensis]|nr:hypothetical protein EDB84DRAFT_586820 [Lactarius hengduanensis]